MYYLFILMVFSYVMSYFYLQTDKMVSNKKLDAGWSKSFLLYHLGYGVLYLSLWMLSGVFFLYTTRLGVSSKILDFLYVGFIVAIVHIFIDIGKEYLNIKFTKNRFFIFILSQLVSVLIVFIGILVLNHYYGFMVDKHQLKIVSPILNILMVFLGLIFLLKPTSEIVMLFLDLSMSEGGVKNISITRSHLAKVFDGEFNKEIGDLVFKRDLIPDEVSSKMSLFKKNTSLITDNLSDNKEILQINVSNIFSTNKAGKWIGYIERLMIFIFYLLGQFTAIAAVMAIKTAFRFNDLKDDNDSQRSEYIMLGTFSSLFVTIMVSVCVKYFMDIERFKGIISVFRATFM